MSRVRVLIVDDSAVVRQVLTELLSQDAGIEVIGVAADPIFAMEKMRRQWPDVIVLDVEMPRMDGITFLKKLMAERPTPVVICSTLTGRGAETTMQALAAGAVDIVAKPTIGLKNFLQESALEFIRVVKAAGQARPQRMAAVAAVVQPKFTADAVLSPPTAGAMAQTTDKVVAIGASTGGTQALEKVLMALPRTTVGIVIVQHMPEKFTAAFAQRLNSICEVEVLEAKTGDRVIPGRALIAPGGRHMLLRRSGAQYQVEVVDGPPVNRHKPSVDVLFRSVAQCAGKNAVGIIMTGMGDDGAAGMLEMRDKGALTIAQDEASCVVFGMPKEAIKHGGVIKVLPLGSLAGEIKGVPLH